MDRRIAAAAITLESTDHPSPTSVRSCLDCQSGGRWGHPISLACAAGLDEKWAWMKWQRSVAVWDPALQPLGPVAGGIAFGDEPGDSLAGPLVVGERGVKRGTDDLLKHVASEFEVHQKIAV